VVVENRDVYINTLKYASAIAGSELTLAARLRVPLAKVQMWLKGIEPVPAATFLAAVDIIVSATDTDIARCRLAMRKAT